MPSSFILDAERIWRDKGCSVVSRCMGLLGLSGLSGSGLMIRGNRRWRFYHPGCLSVLRKRSKYAESSVDRTRCNPGSGSRHQNIIDEEHHGF